MFRNLSIIGASLMLFSAVVVQADALYWCEDINGKSSLVQTKIEGQICEIVESEKPRASDDYQETNPLLEQASKAKPSQQNTQPKTKTNSNQKRNRIEFPSISENEQLTRDQLRVAILYEELQQELQNRDAIRNYLNEINIAQLSTEAKEFYLRKLRGHLFNIKSLQQEIDRIR